MDALTAAAFDQIDAGGIEDKNEPPVGTLGELTVVAAKLGVKENGDEYVVFEYRDREVYFWSDFKWIRKNGSISEGGVKSLKILLGQLGVPNVTGATLQQAVTSRQGRRYTYERTQSGHNPTTNQPYTNTNILGEVPASAGQPPQAAAPATPPVATPPAQAFPPQAQQPAWDQPAAPVAVAPPENAITAG